MRPVPEKQHRKEGEEMNASKEKEIAHEIVSSKAMYILRVPDPKCCAVKFMGCVYVVL